MWNLKYGTNKPACRTETDRHRARLGVARVGGRGEWDGHRVWGSVDADCDIENGEAMRACCAAQGTLSSLLGWTRMDNSKRKRM